MAEQVPDQVPDELERLDSGEGTVSIGSDGLMAREVALRWLVSGMDGYTAAEEKGRDLAPLYYDGHRRTSLSCRPVGAGWYEITATYGNTGISAFEGFGVKNADGVTLIPVGLSVDTTGGTEHVTQAYAGPGNDAPQVKSYKAGGGDAPAPESHGAINVSGNQVNGITKTVPAFNFTETWLVPAWYLFKGVKDDPEADDDGEEVEADPVIPYARTLHDMTGIVNSDDFRIFAPGEVLFLGARYDTNRNQTMVPVTYSFSVRPNLDLFYLDTVQVKEKPGWHYLWLYYEDGVEDSFFPVKIPKYAYVDQIYEERKFSELKIGKNWSQAFMFTGDTFQHPLADDKRRKS